jgi:hypothetical protein
MASSTIAGTIVKVADEVWIATALLHREQPDKADFAVQEIIDRAQREGIAQPLRPGLYVHVVQHCVANRPPNPARYRMLFQTSAGRRRLFHKGDTYHPAREGAKITPAPSDLPPAYAYLLSWCRGWSAAAAQASQEGDPLLALLGSGKGPWSDEHADEYVRRLREGWQ